MSIVFIIAGLCVTAFLIWLILFKDRTWYGHVRKDQMNIQGNIAFLLGAGMPSSSDITSKINEGVGFMRHTDNCYYEGPPLYAHLGFPDDHVPRVVSFIEILNKLITEYYANRNYIISYEDICYVAGQIRDSELGEFDNPAIKPLIDYIKPQVVDILSHRKGDSHLDWDLQYLADETVTYIHCIVWNLLRGEPRNIEYLQDFASFLVQNKDTRIFTLNHDKVLENLLKNCGIEYNDGFGKELNEVRYWDKGLLARSEFSVDLIKLHGSVNWFWLPNPFEGESNSMAGVLKSNDEVNFLNRYLPGYPIMLVGTFNKMLSYQRNIFADMHTFFRKSLDDASTLIIAGYGFRDKGINSNIIEWAHGSKKRILITIDPMDEDILRKRARPAIGQMWNYLKKDGRLIYFQKKIEEFAFNQL